MLRDGIESLKGIGAARAELLKKMGIITVADLLYTAPKRYDDFSVATPIANLVRGQNVCVQVRVLREPTVSYFKGRSLVSASCADATGTVRLKWFNQPFRKNALHAGQTVYACGRCELKNGPSLSNPSTCAAPPGIVPVYKRPQKLSGKVYYDAVLAALNDLGEIPDPIPENVRRQNGILPLNEAFRCMHTPENGEQIVSADLRFAFERLFFYLINVEAGRRENVRTSGISFETEQARKEFLALLPFEPTGAQLRVMDEIAADMRSSHTMNRLIQGDVGSGKTAMAFFAMHVAVRNGRQAVLMAPTEVLARQHYEKLKIFFGDRVCYLGGSVPKREKDKIREGLLDGRYSYIVGTHALLEENVRFRSLGLIVTDEQHRFGVSQRARLESKGNDPDVLVMSATPIPRTLTLLLYGDLELSLIDEMPAGRLPVKTRYVPAAKRDDLYRYVFAEAEKDNRTYVVCPHIDEEDDSEEDEVKNAESVYRELSATFPDAPLGLLHGRMKNAEKNAVLDAFRTGEVRVLVSTTVIEVGVDVPEATVMVIEDADRFGLAQLHQLRGRVGRGKKQSYCFLLTDAANGVVPERLNALIRTNDGFDIAEYDLQLRGPGDYFGTRQHGRESFLSGMDSRFIKQVSAAVRVLFERSDPALPVLTAYAKELADNSGATVTMN